MESIYVMETTIREEVKMSEEIQISKNGISVTLNLMELKESLTSEQRETLAKDLCWDEIMEEAKARLAGSSDCWSGNDRNTTFEFLRDQMIDQALNIKFGAFDRVRQKIKDHLFDSRLYWSLIHCRDEIPHGRVTVSDWFREWSRFNGFEDSNYCDKPSDELANAVIAKFEEILKAELSEAA